MKELQLMGRQLLLPTSYVAMCDSIFSYLTEYRRATGRCPSEATWQQAWRGTADSGGRVLTANFACSRCRMRRRVNVTRFVGNFAVAEEEKGHMRCVDWC